MYDVVIIGAGSAGLSARSEVSKYTNNYLLIDQAPHGTTCAMSGCMPSKILIEQSHKVHDGKKYYDCKNHDEGYRQLMLNLREMRDYFVSGVLKNFSKWEDHFLEGKAEFIDENTVEVDGKKIQGKKFILAVGTRPREFKVNAGNQVFTTDNFFELESLPNKINLIGLGPIGLEIGQALCNLGIEVNAYSIKENFFPSKSKSIQEYGKKYFESILNITYEKNLENLQYDGPILAAIGRDSNLDRLNLGKVFGIKDSSQIPSNTNESTCAWIEHDHIFICGDANKNRAILHEASFEGKIAAYNACHDIKNFERQTPLNITFTRPQIASVGDIEKTSVSAIQSFEDQGRSRTKGENVGLCELYLDKKSDCLVAAEFFCPDAEYMAHLVAWSISNKISRKKLLDQPYYHPTILEGFRSALKKL